MHVEMDALVALTTEKEMSLEQLIQAIEVGVLTAYNQGHEPNRYAQAKLNRETGEISYGRVPSGSVVVSGNLPKTTAAGVPYSMYAAIIVKRVDAQTRSKTSINDLLRA